MRRARSILILTAALLFWSVMPAQSQQEPSPSPDQGGTTQSPGSAQSPGTAQSPEQGASTQSQAPTQSSDESMGNKKSKNGMEKPKHWTGSLVDADCMVKAISTLNARQQATTPQGVSHFLPEAPAGQYGPAGGGAGPQTQPGQGMPPAQQQPMPGQSPSTFPDTAQSAQMARASMIDDAAKQCAARDTTHTFGLVLGDGQIMRFDEEGNAKASAALKESEPKEGKKVKAKVTGTMATGSEVKVASLEIKGKKSSTKSEPTSPSGH